MTITCTRFFRRHAARVAALAGIATATVGYPAPQAGADQLASLRAQAQSVAQRIQSLGLEEDALSEQYDAAGLALQTADNRVAQAGRALAAAERATGAAREALGQEALAAYTGAAATPSMSGAATLGTATAGLVGAEYVNSLAASQQDAVDAYHLATVQDRTAQATLKQARSAAQAKVAALARAQSSVEATQSQLEAVERQDQGQIATLVAQIQAQQLAAQQAAAARAAAQRAAVQAAAVRQQDAEQAAASAAAAADAPTADPAATAPATETAGPAAVTAGPVVGPTASPVASAPPPVGSGAAGAVQAALSRVGDPYVWGGAGPNDFDCSGLVMWAYAQVGISLPHFSGAQFAMGTRIPMSDLEPGDLVFFADPGQHVAMYIGGGDIVEAPHTGASVHVVPMYSEFVQAVRIA